MLPLNIISYICLYLGKKDIFSIMVIFKNDKILEYLACSGKFRDKDLIKSKKYTKFIKNPNKNLPLIYKYGDLKDVKFFSERYMFDIRQAYIYCLKYNRLENLKYLHENCFTCSIFETKLPAIHPDYLFYTNIYYVETTDYTEYIKKHGLEDLLSNLYFLSQYYHLVKYYKPSGSHPEILAKNISCFITACVFNEAIEFIVDFLKKYPEKDIHLELFLGWVKKISFSNYKNFAPSGILVDKQLLINILTDSNNSTKLKIRNFLEKSGNSYNQNVNYFFSDDDCYNYFYFDETMTGVPPAPKRDVFALIENKLPVDPPELAAACFNANENHELLIVYSLKNLQNTENILSYVRNNKIFKKLLNKYHNYLSISKLCNRIIKRGRTKLYNYIVKNFKMDDQERLKFVKKVEHISHVKKLNLCLSYKVFYLFTKEKGGLEKFLSEMDIDKTKFNSYFIDFKLIQGSKLNNEFFAYYDNIYGCENIKIDFI